VTESRVFVGISKVSNVNSLEYLKAIFSDKEIVPVKVEKTIHLKTACSYAGNNIILLCPTYINSKIFKGYEIVEVPKNEFFAANCLAKNGKVVIPEKSNRALSTLEDKGFEVKTVDISEFILAEGSLTCLSILH